ncbi:MAG: hypothetical protein RIS47_1238 [Bacteroidota bacterium]|jgi:UDP-N-acetylmuramyl pentapeptide phosphotransferase/UDP-N-acetylglucosamine-1-phosphate transferase
MDYLILAFKALVILAAACMVSGVLIPTIIKVVRERNLYDVPNERASHTIITPTLGGFAVYLSIMLIFPIFARDLEWRTWRYFFAASILIFSVGIKDDILAISPLKKFSAQLAAALLLTVGGHFRITYLHGFFGIFELPFYASVLGSMLLYVAIMNAYNFIDGIDGLASGVGILHALIFGVWFGFDQQYALSVLAFTLAGALMGFFYYNVFSKDYKIFMGDTGSLTLGLIISILAVKFNERNIVQITWWQVSSAPSVLFAIMALPMFDFLRIIFVRLVLGLPISAPDKRHLHHRMLRLNLSHRTSTFWLIGISLLFAIFGLYFNYISIRRLLLLEILIAMTLSYIPTFIYDQRKKRKQQKNNTKQNP